MAIVLWSHQKDFLKLNPKKHLLAWSCGVGKSLAMIKGMEQNQVQGGAIYKILIICPKSIKEQWCSIVNENANYPEAWKVMTKEEFKKAILTKAGKSVRYKPENIGYYSRICADEIHYFSGLTPISYKYPKASAMLKCMLKYIDVYKPEYIYGATATPYLSSPLNILALGWILGRTEWTYGQFIERFFTSFKIGRATVFKVRKGVEDDVAKLVAMLGSTVTMEETLGDLKMPEQIFQLENFDLTSEQKTAIKNIDEEGIARWVKCHQIVSGTLKGDKYVEDQFFKSEKFDRVLELIKENKKLVITCRYNNEIDYISKNVKDKDVFIINGSTKNKYETCELAEKSDNAVVLIQAATSEGYQLPSFPLMIFYSYDFSLKNAIQLQGRIHRRDKLKRNVYKSLVVKGGIDEAVYNNIKNKKDFDIAIYKE